MYEIQKTITDFTSIVVNLDVLKLQDEVWSNLNITTLFHGVRTNNDNAEIFFVFENEPDAGEKTVLDAIIGAHIGVAASASALDIEKSLAKKLVDDCAGEARAKYVTISPGQTAVYIEKEKQAKAFKDAGYPVDETGYEFITAEKNAQGVSATIAADTVLATAAGWKLLAANIEEIRLDYKNQITAAVDINSVIALRNKSRALLDAI